MHIPVHVSCYVFVRLIPVKEKRNKVLAFDVTLVVIMLAKDFALVNSERCSLILLEVLRYLQIISEAVSVEVSLVIRAQTLYRVIL